MGPLLLIVMVMVRSQLLANSDLLERASCLTAMHYGRRHFVVLDLVIRALLQVRYLGRLLCELVCCSKDLVCRVRRIVNVPFHLQQHAILLFPTINVILEYQPFVCVRACVCVCVWGGGGWEVRACAPACVVRMCVHTCLHICAYAQTLGQKVHELLLFVFLFLFFFVFCFLNQLKKFGSGRGWGGGGGG